MLDYKFDSKANYIVSGTYGSDSMALLDMMQKEGVKPIVCCVNYHKFERSNSDYNALEAYAKEKGLIFEGLDTDALPAEAQLQEGADFSAWARKTRYDFFSKIYKKYDAAGLVLAHQQDDLIETYLLQKSGNAHVAHYGLSVTTTVNDMVVIRPLLHFSKQDLLEYDEENHIGYSASSDEFQTAYTRSPIRREIAKMSEIDRERILDEMKAANDDTIAMVRSLEKDISAGEELDIRAIIALPADAFVTTLMKFVSQADAPVHLTAKKIGEIRKLCLAPQPNLSMKLAEGVYIIKEYDVLTIGKNFDRLPYTYTLEAPGVLNTPDFDLDFSMGAEDRNIKPEDYPLTIRTALPSDTFVVHGFLYPVRILFSEWKMPVRLRYVWPVFANKDGKIIYVPRYRTNFSEYHTSVLHMHLKAEDQEK